MNPFNPTTAETEARTPEELPAVVTRLFKGVLFAEIDYIFVVSMLGVSYHVGF